MAVRPTDLVPHGIPLDELVPLAGDAKALEARVGRAVLVLSVEGMQRPRVLEKTRTHDILPGVKADASYYALPVMKRAKTAPGPILVGRTLSNDIVINDVTLSKLHAFFRETPDGRFFVEDGGSKNGTFVEETQVPARGNGAAFPVPPRSTLRFGSIPLRFFLLDDLTKIIRAKAG